MMQKKIIALAVAGLASTAAFAQSNVTVYGVADVYVGSFAAEGNKGVTSVNSSGLSSSRIGFRGVEDLGGGTKALFTLEYALAIDAADNKVEGGTTGTYDGRQNNSGIGQARQQFVGLTGGFGTAVAGRLQTAGFDFMRDTNAFHGSALNALDRVSPTLLLNSSSRANNAVAYISPTLFGGLTLAVNHARLTESAISDATVPNNATANLFSAAYKVGALQLNAVTANIISAGQTVAGSSKNVRENGLGLSYDFGVLRLLANTVNTKEDGGSLSSARSISAIVPVSAAGSVRLGWANNNIGGETDHNSTAFSLAYLHGLSKRTTAYVGYQGVENQDKATKATAGLAAATGANGLGGNASAVVAGVNHTF